MADYPVTLSDDRITPIASQETAQTGFTHKFKIKYTDIPATATGATDTVTFTLGTTPATYSIDKELLVVRTAFAGTTALTAGVGTSSSVATISATQSILTAGPLSGAAGNVPANKVHGTAAINLVSVFTNATGGSPSACTAGELDIYLGIRDLSKIG